MAAGDISFGGNSGLNSAFLQPTQGKQLYAGNYLDFFNLAAGGQWAQQFLPDVYEKEVEIYGNRTISSFLRMVSAEMPSTSDQIIWLEQGRLHTRYTGIRHVANSTSTTGAALAGAVSAWFYIPDQRGPSNSLSNTTEGDNKCNFRVGQTVMMQQEGGANGRGQGAVIKGIISSIDVTSGDGASNHFQVQFYTTTFAGDAAHTYTALVYGNEFAKGSGNFTEKLDPSYSTYQNSPIIMKEHYAINGSDVSQIGWVEVTSENGASGYLWYVKSEHENRLRWEDYIEMSMVEGVRNTASTAYNLNSFRTGGMGINGGATSQDLDARGTQGFFSALQERGNVYNGLAGDLLPSNTDNRGIAALTDTFDVILKQLDKQGAIEENMLYTNRDLALAFDNFLATQNNYGGAAGVSWGVFNNSSDMAVNLGFSGFRRGSYDFYKTDWKYLNDYSTRGGFGDIEGVMIPAGTSTVYDQNLGKNIKRPFLHVRYRASETENRKMKSWITGSVGGAYTTDIDEMRMHYLTERCLITQGANNFFLLTNS